MHRRAILLGSLTAMCCLMVAISRAAPAGEEPRQTNAPKGFRALFDGQSLDGWEVRSGTATYKVEDGAIVGTTVEGSPNTFLCTTQRFGDFELRFEVKVDPALNSGVQIRSNAYDKEVTVEMERDGKKIKRTWPADRVHGYQVEISNEERGTSGGIYDEARRGWLADISSDPKASKAFKDNEWNAFRVVCRSDRIRTWVNGVPCANLRDDMTSEGFIGLQVHGYKGETPVQVRWRNIYIRTFGGKKNAAE